MRLGRLDRKAKQGRLDRKERRGRPDLKVQPGRPDPKVPLDPVGRKAKQGRQDRKERRGRQDRKARPGLAVRQDPRETPGRKVILVRKVMMAQLVQPGPKVRQAQEARPVLRDLRENVVTRHRTLWAPRDQLDQRVTPSPVLSPGSRPLSRTHSLKLQALLCRPPRMSA